MQITEIKPQLKQEEFLSCNADIVVYGGAAGGGKTWSLLVEPLYHVGVSGFTCNIFRRTYPQINNSGGLWDESMSIYPLWPDTPSPKSGNLEWIFPAGAQVSFRHMDQPEIDYQGSQICLIEFDQLEQFTEHQFFFMLSRNRSMCGIHPYIRATANPQPGWLADFLAWWISEDGYANMDRAGKIRWMGRIGNSIMWADSREDWMGKYANIGNGYGRLEPKSVTFIPSTIYDNKALLAVDPAYLSNLMALPETERQRLLGDKVRGGNWKVKVGGTKFKRGWFEIISQAPRDIIKLRFWDLAATEAKKGKDPDWTAGCQIGWKDGIWYILDVRHDRLSPMNTEILIRQTAVIDGTDIAIRMEQEGGASGKSLVDHYARNILSGFDFQGIPSTSNKEIRANPVSSAAQAGNVKIVSGEWNKSFLDELESFSPDCEHDDQVDALSGAFSELAKRITPHGVSLGLTDGIISAYDNKVNELLEAMSPEERLEADKLMRELNV